MRVHVHVYTLYSISHTLMGVAHFRRDRRERPDEGGVGGVD